jgi:hypothetical protein
MAAPKGNQYAKGLENSGRPSKYKEEYCSLIIEHFTVQPQITKSKKTYYADGTLKSEEEYPVAVEFPTFQNFANKIGVDMTTLDEWKNKHEEFSQSYARAKELQESIWLVNSMGNLYNAQFAQFFGKNCLGYKDKQEVVNLNINQEVGTMTDEELEAELERLKNE